MKNTVAIVGMHKGSRDDAPWDNPDVEIWGMNESYRHGFMKRWDRWFQIHSKGLFSRLDNHNDPDHWKWLQEPHDFPIYMQRVYKNVPAAVIYPYQKMCDIFGNYFQSTSGYMMALAIAEGFKRIEIYGVSMSSDTEYRYQRSNMEYFIGWARGKGIEVTIPLSSALCKGTPYGYESSLTAMRQKLEARLQIMRLEEKEKTQDLYRKQGRLELMRELIAQKEDNKIKLNYDIINAIEAEVVQAGSLVNVLHGAKMEIENGLAILDQHILGEYNSNGDEENEELVMDDDTGEE